ncbi:hypothetical protein, partial [Xanthomonas euvesicatoria]|uniref:hypothetical protein n=1 Tax=Xanthomonas euvesicatoria TaxID=456327 RepID=UPI001B80AD01
MLPTKIEPGSYVRNRPGVCTAAYAEGSANVSRRRETAHRAWSGRARATATVALTRRYSGSMVKALPAKAARPAPARPAGEEVKGQAHPVL